MKKNFSKISAVAIFISIGLIIYTTSIKKDIIDMKGSNDFWEASLNINSGYSCELVITQKTDELELPSEIRIDVLAKEKDIYSNRIKIIKNNNSSKISVFKSTFDSNKYLERNHKDVYVVISFDDQTSKIPLTSINYP